MAGERWRAPGENGCILLSNHQKGLIQIKGVIIDTTEELHGYFYAGMPNLSPTELLFWIAVDETLDQLGVEDVGGVIAILAGANILNTRQKFYGATPGTSIASKVVRGVIPNNIKFPLGIELPTLVGFSPKTLKVIMTRNLSTFVGRAVPVVGWIIIAYDVAQITYKTVTHYNLIVHKKEKLW